MINAPEKGSFLMKSLAVLLTVFMLSACATDDANKVWSPLSIEESNLKASDQFTGFIFQ